jgi:hypothetical protein
MKLIVTDWEWLAFWSGWFLGCIVTALVAFFSIILAANLTMRSW